MKTKLIWVTPDAEKIVMYCARVSNPKNQNSEDFRLIEYLVKNKHWSPLEMASACFEIETTTRIAPQILRHKSFSFQQFSQRYSEFQQFEEVKPRRQDLKNRQNSIDDLSEEIKNDFNIDLHNIQEYSRVAYNKAINSGISKESAAFLLPGTTQTKLYMAGTLRSWIHYVDLRTGNGTQLEHMEIAQSIKNELATQVPNIAKAVNWK